jgi:hypothetical protein
MTVADETILNRSKQAGRNFDRLIALSYAVFAVIFMVLIFAASTSPGTASGEIALMSAFPYAAAVNEFKTASIAGTIRRVSRSGIRPVRC